MQANTADWDFFWFKGTIANAKNAVQPGETGKFFVKGSITSDGNSISADNLTTPLGDVSITYDMKNKVMHGSLVLKGYPLCGFEASGATEMGFGIMMYGNVSLYFGDYSGSICPFISGGAGIGFGIPDGTYNFVSHSVSLTDDYYLTFLVEAGVCFGPLCDGCMSKSYRKTLDCSVTLTTQPKNINFSASLK